MSILIGRHLRSLRRHLSETTQRLGPIVLRADGGGLERPESRAIGDGGDALVSSATRSARDTIGRGRLESERGVEATGRIRRAAGGRPGLKEAQPGLEAALERRVDPLPRGAPMSPLRWTCKMNGLGHRLQAVQKTREGISHPDRNRQFEHINATAAEFLGRTQPVLSVDTRKKEELVGDFKNAKLDSRKYKTGVKIAEAEIRELESTPNSSHGEWNYAFRPRELTRYW